MRKPFFQLTKGRFPRKSAFGLFLMQQADNTKLISVNAQNLCYAVFCLLKYLFSTFSKAANFITKKFLHTKHQVFLLIISPRQHTNAVVQPQFLPQHFWLYHNHIIAVLLLKFLVSYWCFYGYHKYFFQFFFQHWYSLLSHFALIWEQYSWQYYILML